MDEPFRTRSEPGTIALTFDDGPSPWTSVALAELAAADAVATFFVTPGHDPDLVRQAADESHEIGYHCGRHLRHSERNAAEVRAEALAGLDWLGQLGIQARAWRPPWGDLAPWSATLAAELGLDLWLWSDDTHDWDGRGSEEMLTVLAANLSDGSVVLMHDGIGPGARRADVGSTVALIAPLVELARDRGLHPVTLGGALTERPAHA